MYENSDKPVDFSKKPHNVPRKLQSNVYKEITNRELGFNLGRSNHEIEAVAEDKLVTKNYLEMRCELPGQTRSTFLMVFSPDGKKVASTHGNHNVYVTDLTTGKNINTLSGHPRTPWCIAFHPSSNQILATGCLGGQVRVWDLHGGSEVWMAEGQTVIASLAFHPTDRMLVIATYNELHFWDWSQSAPFAKCYTNNEKEKVRYVAFDPLGHKLITGISNVPPHSTQWDRSSAGSHHLSHHHHLYHHQPFQRTSGRYHPVPCTHYQQSTNVPGQRTEEQLETDGRVNGGNPRLSSQREGRTQSGSGEATSSSTSSSYQMPDYERRISVCYRSLAQRYEQLLQRYFDLVRPRYVDTTDRGTDPMEAEETSGSSGNAVAAESTNRCTCNNPATNTDNNRSGTSASTSNTRARNSTRGFSTAINSSSTSSASIVNGTQTANSHARSNSCPCFGNVSMCRRICQSSSSSSLGIHNHIPAASSTSGVSSALTSVASSSTNCANMPSSSHQTSPRATCPSNTGIVSSEVSNCEPEGHPSQSANCSSVNFSSHKSSDAAHTPNENSLYSPARTPSESTTTVTPSNRMEIDHNSLPSPAIRPAESTTTVTESNRMEIDQAENTRLRDPSSADAASISPDMDDQNNSGQCSLGLQQDDLQPQAQSTISNNQEQLVGTEQGTISQRDEHQQPRGSASQTSSDVAATSTRHRDLRRLRNGINTLNHQIDSIQRLCRARMEILQLQHVRRVWGSLQCQINSLQGAVNQMSQSDSSGPDTTEEDQPAQVPNVSQLLELARISDGEPADECSELHASSSSSDNQSVVIRESDQSVTEETASVQATQDWTDDGERPVKRVRIDPQSSSITTQNKLNTDGARVSSKVSHTVSELATGNADPSITDEEHKHGNISGRNNLERDTGSSGSEDAASNERPSVQGHSTEVKIEKLIGHNLPVAGLMTASCSGASSTSQNSDCVAGPSKISRASRLSSVYSSGGRAGRNIDDISSRISQSHQELLNEMQNLRAMQERLSQSSIADRQAGVRPETECASFRKLCAHHASKVQERLSQSSIADRQAGVRPETECASCQKLCAHHASKVACAGTCKNCGSCHPNTDTLHSNSPRLQPTTMHIGSHLPQPRPIYTSVRPQELVASSHSGPTNLVPNESVSSLQETHSEMCMSNCSNVKGEETSCVTKSVSSSKEMTNDPVCERKVDDTKNISSLVSTCMPNASNRTSEEPGENSASSQHDNSKEQEIPTQKSMCGEVTPSQNQATDGVSNSVTNETVSKGDSVSLSNLIADAIEEYRRNTSAINVINKQNPSCSHSEANTTQNVENNSVEANPCSPAGNPADLLSETAAYPANVHPFIPGVVTNFCGNLGEQSSHSLYAQQNTHLSSAPEDLRSHERRAANSGDQLAQVNPSCPQNDNVHGNECTSSNLHFNSSADTRGTFSHSSRRSDGIVSHSERSSNAPRSDIDQIPNPSIIPRQGPLMSPWPDPLLVPRPGSLPTPRASPLLVPGSVQESLRCPRMLHVGGRYYVPRPRFHQRSGHCSRGRTLSRPPTRAELLGRPYFLQTLAETYHCLTGNSIERSNEIIRQMEANSRNRLSRPTASCTIQTQQTGSNGNCNQCADNRDPRLRWRQSTESSNDSSENTSQPSSSNHNDTVFESRVETAVNMTKGQALNCTLETSEQSGESSSSNISASVTSDQFVAPGNKDCAQLPEVEVKLPDGPSDLASGESSTGIKRACASDNTVSQPVAEVACSSLSSASGNNDSAPFCAPSDPATVKDETHSISQNVGCKPGQSTAVTEIAPGSCSRSDNANISSQATAPNEGGVTENVPQSTVEARPSQSSSEGNTNVTVSQPQESRGRSAATQTPGPPLGRPDSVGASRGSDPPASQNGVRLQLPRNGTSRTVRDIFGRLQRLLDYERMYRQTVMDPTGPTNPLPTRRSSGPFNTTPAHSNTATDVWGRWTRRPSDIVSERLTERGISFSGQAARVAAERLITALQTELCETERLHQRLANSPRPSASPDQTAGELSQETTRQRARQVLCVMVESLTQVFEENDPFHNFSRDVSDSRVRLFLSDLYFLLQLALELVDLLLIQISRPWRGVGALLENGVESTCNSRHYTRDQISHPRPRGTGSFRFYARRGSCTHRPSDGYSRQLSAGASGTVHTSPVRTLSRHRTGRPLGRGSWVHRFFGASTRFLPGMMQGTRGTDTALPQMREVSPADRDGHGDSERGGPMSRSSRLPSSTRGVRGRFQRGSSTCHHGHQQRHSHLFHNFHNYCRQPEEEVQAQQQQQSQPSRHLSHHSQQQHQNSQELEEQQQQQQQQQPPPPEEGQQPQLLSSDSGQQGQSRQQQEHLEEQPQDGGHVHERNSEYRSEHSQNQRESNNQSLTSTISQILSTAIQMGQQEVDNTDFQILSSANQRRRQPQRNTDTFAVPAVQLNDVPIADVGQLSQIEPPHIRPQSPPANPFGVVSRQSHQMLGGLPPSERWLVNFDEVYPNTGVTNSTSAGRQFSQYPFMGLVQGSLSESSNRRSTSNFPGSSRGPINNSPPINDSHIHRPQSDTESWTYGAPTGWRSRFLHPRYVGPNMFNDESFASIDNFSFIRGPDTVIITDAPLSPNHRIQAWDISKFNIPDISNAEKNIIVSECKIHNDASVDVSKDGTLLVTLLPSNRICVTTMLGIYSLEWESLGQCLYTTSFEQNAVSVSLSPACRHLLVGLASRRIVLPTDRPTVAQIFRMEGAKPGRSVGGRGRLCHLRDIEHNRENSFTSLNCIRWAPEAGQGLVYGTNTGTLRVLR